MAFTQIRGSATYTADELRGLQEKFGTPSGLTPGEIFESIYAAIAVESTQTTLSTAYTFNKVRYLPLAEDDLSAIDEEEATQNVTVETTTVVSTVSSDGGGTTY